MNRRQLARVTSCLTVWPLPLVFAADLGERDAASGIRAALERGALAAIGELGRADGFLANPRFRIPLPKHLEDAARLLSALGQKKRVEELVTAMNRAAEVAVPEARTLFVQTARGIKVQDALAIVRGGSTSVTDYFAGKTREPLAQRFLPIVTRATEKVQLAERYNAVAAKAADLHLISSADANLQQYVTGRALDALFAVIGDEEKKIRADPIGTGSAILKKVFGG